LVPLGMGGGTGWWERRRRWRFGCYIGTARVFARSRYGALCALGNGSGEGGGRSRVGCNCSVSPRRETREGCRQRVTRNHSINDKNASVEIRARGVIQVCTGLARLIQEGMMTPRRSPRLWRALTTMHKQGQSAYLRICVRLWCTLIRPEPPVISSCSCSC
jgi:hypothetical protein